MARITDRPPFLDGQRFFFRSIKGHGLRPRGAGAGGCALQSECDASFCGTRIALMPAVRDRTSWLSDGFLSDRRMKCIFRWFACSAAMTST